MSTEEETALFEQTRPEAEDMWQKLLSILKRKINKPSYETWFAHTLALGIKENTLFIGVQNDFARDWLESRYLVISKEILSNLLHREFSIKFVIPTPAAVDPTDPTISLPEQFEQKLQQTRQELLDKIAESEKRMHTDLQQVSHLLQRILDQTSAPQQNNAETAIQNG